MGGFKSNMNDITATLGCVAMDHLDDVLARRRVMADTEELSGLKKVQLLNYQDHWTPNYQIFPIHVQERESLLTFVG